MQKLIIATAMLAMSACSNAEAEPTVKPSSVQQADDPTSLTTAAGTYSISEGPAQPTIQNADLKMADSFPEYAGQLCGLDFADPDAPERCEIYIQPDKSGTMIGYAVLKEGDGISITTAVQTNDGRGCFVDGKLNNVDFDNASAPLRIENDFEANTMYAAWEKTPGNWMLSDSEDSHVSDDAQYGVWYVKSKGDKLRITQERWNYCYPDPDVFMDDVFEKVMTLSKK